jgi:hypothetical protein
VALAYETFLKAQPTIVRATHAKLGLIAVSSERPTKKPGESYRASSTHSLLPCGAPGDVWAECAPLLQDGYDFTGSNADQRRFLTLGERAGILEGELP